MTKAPNARAGPLACLMPFVLAGFTDAAPPLIVAQSGSAEVRQGRSFASLVVTVGEAPDYQWYHDGQPLAGQTGDTLLLASVTPQDAGSYQVVVANEDGSTGSEPVTLVVTAAPALGVAPGGRGLVSVPGQPACYDLYLPPNYPTTGRVLPVLFTFNPSGGGMVDHFRTVAEEEGWIVVGVTQSRNSQGTRSKMLFSRAVFQHALDNLNIDPNRIFVAGMSGGGWSSFDIAKINAPLVAAVFSMGGWLGQQYSSQRDIYLSGLLVARANGDADTAANSWLAQDRSYLSGWIGSQNIKDWSFPGGHVPAPESVQREVFDWFLSLTVPSTTGQRRLAREQEALWRARISAGEARAVYQELVDTAFNQPRTPDALAAWRTIDFLFSEDRIFLRDPPPDCSGFPRRNFLAVNLYHALFAFAQQRDPARMFSGVAAARALGGAFQIVQEDPTSEIGNIFRHPPHTSFDALVLDHALYDRTEPPLTGDWDGDGRDNFGECAMGTSPLVADPPASPVIQILDQQAYAVLPGCRIDPTVWLAAATTTDPSGSTWAELPVYDGWWRHSDDGTCAPTSRIGNVLDQPNLFVRFTATLDDYFWHDANADGIPWEYQFPGGTWDGNSPDLPDARNSVDLPGGAPMYRRYLTAAEIGAVESLGASLRYHPALAGYRGYLCQEVWMNVQETTLAGGAAVAASRPPNEIRLITSSEAPWFSTDAPTVMGDYYFERTRGYLIPAVSGSHVFSIAGDDDCELWLSTGSSAAGASRIAHVSGWTGYRNFTASATQTSAPITLVAGRPYYLEILHRDGNGTDHCSVAWITPGSSTAVIIPSTNLGCLAADLIGDR